MSSTDLQIKKGDKIIDYGRVFNVYKITKSDIDKKQKDCIYYKPHFPNEKSRVLECSLPKESLEVANIRKVGSKTDLIQALKKIKVKTKPKKLTTAEIEEQLKKNDLQVSASTISQLWATHKSEDIGLTTKNKMLMERAIDSIAEELALVHKTTLKKAREKILRLLK